MTTNRINIGIDVGWSVQTRSCGVAVMGIDPNWQDSGIARYGSVSVKLFSLRELVQWLPGFIDSIADSLPNTTVVVDGPLGLSGRPEANRYIDSACRVQGFHLRAFPNDVTGISGQLYVNATYQIVEPFLKARVLPWLGERIKEGLIVAETHPTVGLALQLPQLDPRTLPSRRNPFILSNEGDRLVRAKSDWYWMRGAGREISQLLDAPVAHEMHHERRAALYCLAAANALSADRALVVGRAAIQNGINATGVYVFPADVHADWAADVNRIGVVYGEPDYRQNGELVDISFRLPGGSQNIGIAAPPSGVEDEGHDDGELPYGQEILYLCDNGGVWGKHNSWLEDCNRRATLQACDVVRGDIRLGVAKRSGQWVVENNGSTLQLARSRGFLGQHLSHAECVQIPVTVIQCE